jgi:polyphosphate glucokinase
MTYRIPYTKSFFLYSCSTNIDSNMINENTILGIDIGGTGTKFALVDTTSGKMLTDRFKQSTPKPATPEAVLDVIAEQMMRLDWSGPIGCGLPSIVQRGVAKSAANIDDAWIGLNVEEFFSSRLSCEATVINDADAAGIAEMEYGVGKGRDGVVMMITVGTGIGSALFCDEKLVPNTELGHIKFKGDTAEKYASNSMRKKKKWKWEEWASRFNEILNHYERLFSPDLFILGGGLSKNFHLYHTCFDCNAEIIPAKMQNAAGVIGAAMAARYSKELV